MNVVVDASVVVKWYVSELDSELARSVMQTEGILVAPGHCLGEVGHVLIQRFREGKISGEQLSLARIAIPGTLLLISIDGIFDLAMEIAIATRQSFYDALYVAAAVRWDTQVVTADEGMADIVSGSDWAHRVVLLKDWPARRRV